MIRITTFDGRKVAVFGLGLTGLATIKALLAGGADVAAWDDGEAGRNAAAEAGGALTDLKDADWSEFAALVLSPGVPLTHPEPHWTVTRARAAGVEIIGDTELFFRERAKLAPEAPVVAITGTNGKSTTTALVAHLLRHLGLDVQMGGNIGVPILALEPPSMERIHVIEFSSYQIDLTPSLAPTVGVLLNISPDHLERHGSLANYAGIKARIVSSAETAVVGLDDDWCRHAAMARSAVGLPTYGVSVIDDDDPNFDGSEQLITFAKAADAGVTVINAEAGSEIFRFDDGPQVEVLAHLDNAKNLRGGHNAQNAAAAVAIARALGSENTEGACATMTAGLDSFPGLAHRMEILGERDHVLFVNDSKGTNADAAEKALAAFEDIYWIAGGLPKDGGIAGLEHLFSRIAKAYLIGEAAEDFARTLEGQVEYELSGTLAVATARAAEDAAKSDAPEAVVLLSPACASFDQFKSFARRGDEFRNLVGALPGMTLNPRIDL